MNDAINYQEKCFNDSDCPENSICFKGTCGCKPKYQFKRGICGKFDHQME